MLDEGCETSRLGRAQDWRTQRAASFEQDYLAKSMFEDSWQYLSHMGK